VVSQNKIQELFSIYNSTVTQPIDSILIDIYILSITPVFYYVITPQCFSDSNCYHVSPSA
jgi:hypothetical protein